MKAMRALRQIGRGAFAALLTLSLIVWSVAPAAAHAAVVFDTLRDQAAMVADHGHSHGFQEDLFAAMHGHSHDAADHDHSEVMQTPCAGPAPAATHGDARRLPPPRAGPVRLFRIERPPRA